MGDEPTQPLRDGSRQHADADTTRATAPGDPAAARASGAPQSAPVPARIGRYTIVRVLGEGGMGTVYEAVQENPKRTVALKVIKAGYLSPALLRRFEQESQVLGRLQHPGIAQVYEAGVFANPERERRATPAPDDQTTPASTVPFGTPFFAMEFIKGIPLTDYVTQKNLGTRDRLELLAKVCDAVYHAHQKGVIHRDLKPGNILVDESGQPKILDFGVARATDSDLQQTTIQTDIGAIIGTVPYMSPEQVGGDPNDLDTRSDVYALGVIAYELLAGRLPYDLQRKMIHEAARIIREDEPTRLSSINRTLRGDIETIVTHALEKDKVRRYQSAESLASDIRRYLKDEPIAARPASSWYQAAKFAKRNTGLVAGLAAAFILLIAGLAGTGYGLRQAITARDSERAARTEADEQRDAAVKAREAEEAQRKTAEAQRDKAEIIAEFMSETLAGVGPSVARSRDTTMLREMMDAAAARIDQGDLKDTPEAELRLRATIGNTYRELAQFDAAARMIERSVDLARSLHPGDHPDVARALNNLALMRKSLGREADAEPLFEQSLAIYQRIYPGDHPNVAVSLNNLAAVRESLGRAPEAEPLFVQALEITQRMFPGDHPDVARSLNSLAHIRQSMGRAAEAEPLFEQALEMRRRLFPGDHPDVANSLSNMANVRWSMGRAAQAEPLFEQALEMRRRLFPGDHPDVAMSLNNLAYTRQSLGRAAEAEPLFEQALEMRRRVLPRGHPHTSSTISNLARLRDSLSRPAESEPLWRELLDLQAGAFKADDWRIAITRSRLGGSLLAQSRFAEAEPLLIEGYNGLAASMDTPRQPDDLLREACKRLVMLYESAKNTDSDESYDAKASEWKAKLDSLTPPAAESAVPR